MLLCSRDKFNEIPGWRLWITAQVTDMFNQFQRRRRIMGNLLEVGVYHGRFLYVLSSMVRPGQRLFGVDIEIRPDIHEWANPKEVLLIEQDSTTISSDAYQMMSPFRIVSIDGNHEKKHALYDLQTVSTHVLDGILVVDDLHNINWPGVTEALYEFMNPQWSCFAMDCKTAYICRRHMREEYLNCVRHNWKGKILTKEIFDEKAFLLS